MDIDDPYVAYCFDEAVMATESLIEAELDIITHKNSKTEARKKNARLDQLLGIRRSSIKGSFSDPAAR